MFKSNKMKQDEPYQDSVSALVDCSFDDDAVGLDDDDESEDSKIIEALESLKSVASAIEKVSYCLSSDTHVLIPSAQL